MRLAKEKHIAFFDHQIKSQEERWREYADCAMNILIQEKRIFIGRIWGVQEAQGNVFLRFNEGEVPRMKQSYFLGLVGTDAPENPATWKFSYKNFRESSQPRFYSGVKAEIYTVTYWKNEDGRSYILVSGFDSEVLSILKERYLDQKVHPLIVVAETDPPVDYLRKLKEFVSKSQSDTILNLDFNASEDDYRPIILDNESNITDEVIQSIEVSKTTLIQGPPGTGKSYLAAELCDHYLKQGKSVCITSLTNRALIEIAAKDGLIPFLSLGKVYKTNLSRDEMKSNPMLKRVESFTPKAGELLLITYYKLAQKQSEFLEGLKRYDLLIIEEASQAYLATIAMFSTIAERILIIGDHQQLTPVVVKEEEAQTMFGNIEGIVNGLKTLAFNSVIVTYRLSKTRRLTSAAAKLTGSYYNHSLSSVSDFNGRIVFRSKYRGLFHDNGGITIVKLPVSRNGFTQKEILKFICSVAGEIIMRNQDMEIALLTPYVSIESELYEQFFRQKREIQNITINTIHKIQGLTTDLTLLYLPLNSPAFDLNANLFNVATSRSKQGTLIVSYSHIDLVSSVSKETKQFINGCIDVTDEFMNQLNATKY
jgi:hypothetical protein